MRDVWYVLEDGTRVSPSEVVTGDDGALRHSSGAAVAIGAHGNPRSAGVDVDEHGNLIVGSKAAAAKDMTPQVGRASYKTRESAAK